MESTYGWHNLNRLPQQIFVTDFWNEKKNMFESFRNPTRIKAASFFAEFDIILSTQGSDILFSFVFFSIKINSQFYITFTFISTNLSTLNVFKEIWNFLPCMKHWCLQRSNPLSLNRNQAHWNLIYRITGFQIARTQLLIICRRLFFHQKKNDEIIFSDSFWMFWAQQIKSYGWIQEI